MILCPTEEQDQEEDGMHILLVSIRVKPESSERFIRATRENVRETLKEPGVLRFDLLRRADDPENFALFEVYRQAEDYAKHRETEHYKRWNAVAQPLMIGERTRVFYESVFPKESGWE
jgi:autoinducer 2-degrading protein